MKVPRCLIRGLAKRVLRFGFVKSSLEYFKVA